MFESIKHWLDTLEQQGCLFDHPEDPGLQAALASVLYHVISADQHLDTRKKHEFKRMLGQSLGLDDAQTEALYHAASASSGDLHGDLHTINFFLKRNPVARLDFMRRLMQLIDVEGVDSREMDIFFEALHEFFPEIRDLPDDPV